MKILFCINSLGGFGGLERVTIVKANALSAIPGNEVGICFSNKGSYPKTIHPLSPAVKVFFMDVSYWEYRNMSDVLIGFVPMILKMRKALIGIIDSFEPDVVVTTGTFEKYALASLSITGIKGRISRLNRRGNMLLIREYHFNSGYRAFMTDSRIKLLGGEMVEWFENNILSRFFDKTFLLTKADMEDHFKGRSKFDYMYNPSSFCPDVVSEYSTRPKVILAVGRMTAEKNFKTLVEIWNRVSRKASGWKLRIVGDGKDMDDIRRLVRDFGIEKSVELPGKSDNVQKEMDSAQIYVMTSRNEGLPLVLLEAQALGVPIVSFDTPYGPAEIVRNGIDGLIVGYNDSGEFAGKLLELIDNDALRQRMSAEALKRREEFTVERIIGKWMENYNRLLANKAPLKHTRITSLRRLLH